jgi:DNA-binding CsgD family transcriptional regulator
MERLTSRHLRMLSESLRTLYAFRDLDGFVQYLIREIPKLVPSDITVYGEINPQRRRFRFAWTPHEVLFPGWEDVYRKHLPEHPFAQRYQGGGEGGAVKISDLISLRQFRQLGLYDEVFRRIGVDREMIAWLPTLRPMEITIGVHRVGSDFSERDRLLLNLLRPHLIQAYRNAEAVTLLQATGDGSSRGVVFLGPAIRVHQTNDAAKRLIATYFGAASGRGTRLPDDLERWVRHETRLSDASDDIPPERKPLVVGRDGTRLTVRLLAGHSQHLLLLEEERTSMPCEALEVLGLTRREGEVLTWVAQAKTNEAIALILHLSQRTVEKHLENIYLKLGVENRTAAAARALEVLSSAAS